MGGFDCCGLVATAYHLAGYSTPYRTNVPGLMREGRREDRKTLIPILSLLYIRYIITVL